MAVHPSAVIEDDVVLGSNVVVGPFAVIHGGVTIGNNVVIGSHVTIGTAPEIRGRNQVNFVAESELAVGVRVGNGCVIREHATIQRGSRETTTIGDDTWLLGHAYVAHDVQVGQHVTISAGARLAGHSRVHDWTNIGMNASVHQHRVVGAGSMIGMSSSVTRDIPPLAKAFGVPCQLRGVNTHLSSNVLSSEDQVQALSALYETVGLDLVTALDENAILRAVAAIQEWLASDPSRAIFAR